MALYHYYWYRKHCSYHECFRVEGTQENHGCWKDGSNLASSYHSANIPHLDQRPLFHHSGSELVHPLHDWPWRVKWVWMWGSDGSCNLVWNKSYIQIHRGLSKFSDIKLAAHPRLISERANWSEPEASSVSSPWGHALCLDLNLGVEWFEVRKSVQLDAPGNLWQLALFFWQKQWILRYQNDLP